MPTREEIDAILSEACIKLGFCLQPADQDRIAALENVTPRELAIQIVEAEGLNTITDAHWVEQLERLIEKKLADGA